MIVVVIILNYICMSSNAMLVLGVASSPSPPRHAGVRGGI